jgi:DNA-binding transcriptional LysR family regulator
MDTEARLRAFAAVARRGSFSAAAEELVISQPAVSKHVAELEAQLQTRLVDRLPRGVRLTEAGQFVADHVLRAEALLAQAERGVASIGRTLAGRLAVGASGNGMYLIPAALAAFHRDHPGVEVHVAVGTSAEIAEGVRAHRFEVGILGGFAAAPELDAEPLVEDEIVLVAAPAVARRIASAKDLDGLTWIAREEGSSTRAVVEAAWSDLGISPSHRLSFPSWEGVKLTVAAGAGVAAMSRYAIDVELKAKTLVIVNVRGWTVRRHLSLVRPSGIPLTPPAQRFIESLRATLPAKNDAARSPSRRTARRSSP